MDPSFDELIEDASTQKLTAMEREDYLKALEISERDRVVLYEGGYYMGHRDGVEEGREEERLSNARIFKSLGVDPEIICQATGLSAEQVAATILRRPVGRRCFYALRMDSPRMMVGESLSWEVPGERPSMRSKRILVARVAISSTGWPTRVMGGSI